MYRIAGSQTSEQNAWVYGTRSCSSAWSSVHMPAQSDPTRSGACSASRRVCDITSSSCGDTVSRHRDTSGIVGASRCSMWCGDAMCGDAMWVLCAVFGRGGTFSFCPSHHPRATVPAGTRLLWRVDTRQSPCVLVHTGECTGECTGVGCLRHAARRLARKSSRPKGSPWPAAGGASAGGATAGGATAGGTPDAPSAATSSGGKSSKRSSKTSSSGSENDSGRSAAPS